MFGNRTEIVQELVSDNTSSSFRGGFSSCRVILVVACWNTFTLDAGFIFASTGVRVVGFCWNNFFREIGGCRNNFLRVVGGCRINGASLLGHGGVGVEVRVLVVSACLQSSYADKQASRRAGREAEETAKQNKEQGIRKR